MAFNGIAASLAMVARLVRQCSAEGPPATFGGGLITAEGYTALRRKFHFKLL
jgi:hypothetical protein